MVRAHDMRLHLKRTPSVLRYPSKWRWYSETVNTPRGMLLNRTYGRASTPATSYIPTPLLECNTLAMNSVTALMTSHNIVNPNSTPPAHDPLSQKGYGVLAAFLSTTLGLGLESGLELTGTVLWPLSFPRQPPFGRNHSVPVDQFPCFKITLQPTLVRACCRCVTSSRVVRDWEVSALNW
jgi:hypothetical protein